jgi:hypothetical protein
VVEAKPTLLTGWAHARIAQGIAGASFTWIAPLVIHDRVRVQIRADGRDANGAEVASHATRWIRVKKSNQHRIHVARPRNVESGQWTEIHWKGRGLARIDLDYRVSARRDGKRVMTRNWTGVARGVTDNPINWRVPGIGGEKPRVQIRAIGRDASGAAVATAESGWSAVRQPR